jgi:hypothetical protein
MEMTTKTPEIQPEICILNQFAFMVVSDERETYHRCDQENLGNERASPAYVRRSSLHLTHRPGDDNKGRKQGRNDDGDKESRLFPRESHFGIQELQYKRSWRSIDVTTDHVPRILLEARQQELAWCQQTCLSSSRVWAMPYCGVVIA